MTAKINDPTPVIKKAHDRWKRARDIIEGEDEVKKNGVRYLPKPKVQMSDEEYERFKSWVPFEPVAANVLANLVGLIFRKEPTTNAPTGLLPLLDTITMDGLTSDDLAEELLRETLITNFTGLLVDHPRALTGDEAYGVSKLTAIGMGVRPFIAMYRAESILEVTPMVISNRVVVQRVRLLEGDDNNKVRELVLVDGIYTVREHENQDGTWNMVQQFQPTDEAGNPMREIPFLLVTTANRRFVPQKAQMDDVVSINVNHFKKMGDVEMIQKFASNPILGFYGVDDEFQCSAVPGEYVKFQNHESRGEYIEYKGPGVEHQMRSAELLLEAAGRTGMRMAAAEKAAAEAAETHARRGASENSRTASFSRIVSRKLTEAFRMVAKLAEITGEVEYSLNTDFLPMPIEAQKLTAVMGMVTAGLMSRRTFHKILQDGEILPESLTYEEERDRIEEDVADMPPATAAASSFPQEPVDAEEE